MVIFNDQFQRLLSFGRMQVFSAAISSLVQQACLRFSLAVLFARIVPIQGLVGLFWA